MTSDSVPASSSSCYQLSHSINAIECASVQPASYMETLLAKRANVGGPGMVSICGVLACAPIRWCSVYGSNSSSSSSNTNRSSGRHVRTVAVCA
jgi:hypothetical protein